MADKISVIVPIYKVEMYLEQCIQSILRQTYANLEIILIDDGSPDQCPKICDHYASADNRIIVVHKKNEGLSAARNTGIKIATGRYIGFIDSDDYIHPDMYQSLYDAIMSNNADISVCKFHMCSENDTIYLNKRFSYKTTAYCGFKRIMNNFFDRRKCAISVVAWNKLYKKELFDNVRYPNGKNYEDEATTYQLFAQCNCVVYVNAILYYYYQRSDSIMGKQVSHDNLKVFNILKEIIEFYNQRGQKRFVTKAIIRYFKIMLIYLEKIEKDNVNAAIYIELKNIYSVEYKKYLCNRIFIIIHLKIYKVIRRILCQKKKL